MARFTRQAIMDAFAAAISERPLSKITVTDLVEACGINRNTFYYYFHDIYALASAVLEQGISRFLQPGGEPVRFSEQFRLLTEYAKKNRRLVYHIYHSDHILVEQQLYRAVYPQILARVRNETEGIDCTTAAAEQLAAFYSYALLGSFLKWLNGGMREPIGDYVAQMSVLLDSSPRLLLQRSRRLVIDERAV